MILKRLFKDLTDLEHRESGGQPDYRYNDRRGAARARLSRGSDPLNFLLKNGVKIVDKAPYNVGGHAVGSARSVSITAIWLKGQSLKAPRCRRHGPDDRSLRSPPARRA